MAKQRTTRKSKAKKNETKTIKKKFTISVQHVIPLVVIVLIIAGYIYVKNSSYFKLEDIVVIDKSKIADVNALDLLKVYKGRNIFDIDLKALSTGIAQERPIIKKAVAKRILPNRIEIDIVSRIPIAVMFIRGKAMYIDKTAIVIKSGDYNKNLKVPEITGFRIWMRPHVGEKIEGEKIKKALELISAIKKVSLGSENPVKRIDISDVKNLRFFVDGIKVIIGGESFTDRLKRFKKNINNPNLDKRNIKYIDLRFKDVVIGPK